MSSKRKTIKLANLRFTPAFEEQSMTIQARLDSLISALVTQEIEAEVARQRDATLKNNPETPLST